MFRPVDLNAQSEDREELAYSYVAPLSGVRHAIGVENLAEFERDMEDLKYNRPNVDRSTVRLHRRSIRITEWEEIQES